MYSVFSGAPPAQQQNVYLYVRVSFVVKWTFARKWAKPEFISKYTIEYSVINRYVNTDRSALFEICITWCCCCRCECFHVENAYECHFLLLVLCLRASKIINSSRHDIYEYLCVISIFFACLMLHICFYRLRERYTIW